MHAKAAANAEIDQFRREIAAAILSEIEGLSVREAEALTGLRPITISRLRRGLAREFALEGLIGAAMKLGLPVKIHIGKRPPPKRKDGREGTRRPKKTRADQIL
jgi:hypothetical protein